MTAFSKTAANSRLNIGQQMKKLFSWLRDMVRIYWASLKTKRMSLQNNSNQKSKPTTAQFFQYDDILLRLFIDVAETSGYQKLVRTGLATDDECMEAWENIVRENSEKTGSNSYSSYFNDTVQYSQLLSEYLFMRAALTKLLYVIDFDLIQKVREFGYMINLSNSQAYADSLYATSRRVDNLATRIKMQYNRMALNTVDKSEGGGFDETIANLNMAIGFVETDNITLARYNEYCKTLKKRAARSKDNGGYK